MNKSEKNQMFTECIAPPALSEEDLFAALDHDATAQILTHLEQCPFCSMRLEDMQKFEQSLHRMMYRADCPSSDQLADSLLGTLNMDDKAKLDSHLKQCVLCRGELESLQAIIVPIVDEKVRIHPQETLSYSG